MISLHPAFWTLPKSNQPYFWNTGSGDSSLSLEIYENFEGEVTVSIEGGRSVPPLYREHYHDIRLDSAGRSHEEAVLLFAEKLHIVFDENGNERPRRRDDYGYGHIPEEIAREATRARALHEALELTSNSPQTEEHKKE